jgi:hypothetical protein
MSISKRPIEGLNFHFVTKDAHRGTKKLTPGPDGGCLLVTLSIDKNCFV